jgi:hypothetical protein
MKNNPVFILIIFISVSFMGCKTTKEQISDEGDAEIVLVQNTPEILMINFFMDSRDSVKVINTLKNPGRLRGEFDSKPEPGEGDLIISLLNETNIVCSKTFVENPLVRRVEYSETDDISTLTAKTIDLDSAEFFIRVQYDDCFRHLKVEKYENEEIKLLKFLRNYNFPK